MKMAGKLLIGTYFETTETVTGQVERAKQGWDAAVYAIWTN